METGVQPRELPGRSDFHPELSIAQGHNGKKVVIVHDLHFDLPSGVFQEVYVSFLLIPYF
jgi:hypothetical protein